MVVPFSLFCISQTMLGSGYSAVSLRQCLFGKCLFGSVSRQWLLVSVSSTRSLFDKVVSATSLWQDLFDNTPSIKNLCVVGLRFMLSKKKGASLGANYGNRGQQFFVGPYVKSWPLYYEHLSAKSISIEN